MNFPGIIRIDLTRKGEVRYDCTEAQQLWLAKVVAINGAVQTNPFNTVDGPTAIIGIRIDSQNNDQMPWSIQDGFMNTFQGRFSKLYVTVLANPNSDTEIFLNTGNGVSAQYGSFDGLSPVVGGSGGSSHERDT
jgi:hypothetical protein